jgi:hypothetical protein
MEGYSLWKDKLLIDNFLACNGISLFEADCCGRHNGTLLLLLLRSSVTLYDLCCDDQLT